MGMYAYVESLAPLPDGTDGQRSFQTKDLECDCVTVYRITAEGRLLEKQWHYTETPREKKPCPDAKPGTLGYLFGALTVVDEGWTDLGYHGLLDFYDEDHRYQAKFTDGALVEITGGKDATEENTDEAP